MGISVQLRVLTVCLAFSVVSFATDVATLRNGFEIRHERSERMGDVIRLYLEPDQNSSYMDVPTDQIVAIQHLENASPIPKRVAVASKPEPVLGQSKTIKEVVSTASRRNLVDADLISSVIQAESNFNPAACSPKGAQGLMQLMPTTAAHFSVKNAFEPEANVNAGSSYLHDLLARYDGDIVNALAAYNAGPDRVAKYHGVPPFPETRSYVARVVREFNKRKSIHTIHSKN